MKIYIGSDHTGFELKEKIKKYLSDLGLGYELEDKGAFTYNKDDDYPDFIRPVAEAVTSEKESFGIILGGSGQGEAMCANKTKGIRAAVFYGQKEALGEVDISGKKSSDTFEIVELEREHNNANILSIGVRFVTEDEAKFACELFLRTKFSGEERHIRRINKIE
ncbi:MAG: RpiB/LacA/LacB family sugar-phosphate isomerase [bacterium]